jgi:UDP-glucose 4-epimerase
MHETLCTREELQKAEDMGGYFRIPIDGRNLNYTKYFSEGEPEQIVTEDYNSSNTDRLTIYGVKELLLSLPKIQKLLQK